jgi:hypothetical protein
MAEQLGDVFKTGDTAPQDGNFQLIGEDTSGAGHARTDTGRVIRLAEGEALPAHPDTGQPTEWRFIRVTKTPLETFADGTPTEI